MAVRSIKISWAASHYVHGRDDGIRVRFNVVCANNMTSKVFAYRMLPLSPLASTAVGHFSHVCSPPDIEEYPADEPAPAFSPEWFRLDYVDVLVRSVFEAEDFIAVVRGDVRRLKSTLDTMDTIFPGGIDTLGADCDPALSSSSSLSLSSISSLSIGSMQSLAAFGTTEQSIGFGVPWLDINDGAGSPIGISDSLGLNRSRVSLRDGETSQLLLVQGFDFSNIPDTAIVEGLHARTALRDATVPGSSSSSSLSSLSAGPSPHPMLTFLALQHPAYGLGDNKAVGDAILGPAWQELLHGGSGDLWGLPALSGADLKRGAFGLSIVVALGCAPASAPIEVDGVELTAYYRETA